MGPNVADKKLNKNNLGKNIVLSKQLISKFKLSVNNVQN